MDKSTKSTSILMVWALFCLTMAACGNGVERGGTSSSAVSDAVDVTPAMLERGQAVYTLNCAPCHGAGGKGDGPSAKILDPQPRDHTDPELMEKLTDRRIGETTQKGGAISGYPNMPSSPHIRGDDLVALVAFVRSLHRETVESVDLEGLQ